MQDIILDSGQGRRRPAGNNSRLNGIIRGFLLALTVGLLWGLDFLLYVRSGTAVIFDGIWNTSVLSALLVVVLTVMAAVAVLFFSGSLQRLVFSLLCSVWIWGFMSQFLQIDKSQYLTVFLTPLVRYEAALLTDGYSHWIVGGIVFIAAYIVSGRFSRTSLAYLAGILFFVLAGFLANEMLSPVVRKPLVEVYNSNDSDFSDKNKKIVFLFMPNLSSYGAIGQSSNNDVDKNDQLRNVELGFFVKYGFMMYPNAYVIHDNKDANLVEILNILDNKPFDEHVLNNVGLEKLWKFKSPQRTEIFLKDNQLQDVFRKAGYKISVYQNQNIELCKKNNQYTVDRCINRTSLPFDINNAGFSETERVVLLIKQWLTSMDILQNNTIVTAVQYLVGREEAREFSLPYERLYVVDSVQVLQKLLEDMAMDKGAGVYFVYLDFPDNLLIYDEWCKVRPQNKWNTLNPKVNLMSVSRNTREYNEQALCFWGQMGELMDNLEKVNSLGNMTIIMQSISGKRDATADSLSFIEKFKEQKSALTAIRDNTAKFGVSNRICSSKDILRAYLFNTKKCDEFNGLAIAGSSREVLRADLKERKVTKEILPAAAAFYEDWQAKRKSIRLHPDLKLKKIQKDSAEQIVDVNALQTEDAVKALVDGLHSAEKAPEPKAEAADVVENAETSSETEDVPLEYSEKEPTARSQEKMSEPEVVVEPVSDEAPAAVEASDMSKQAERKVEPENKPNDNEAVAVPEVKEEKQPESEIKKVKESPEVPVEALKQEKNDATTEAEVTQNNAVPPLPEAEMIPETVVEPVAAAQISEKAETEQSEPVAAEAQPQPEVEPATVEAQTESTLPVSADFLIDEDDEEEWELDPAKALGVSGDEKPVPVEKIVVKVK